MNLSFARRGLERLDRLFRRRLPHVRLCLRAAVTDERELLVDSEFLQEALSVNEDQHRRTIWELIKIGRILAVLGVELRFALYAHEYAAVDLWFIVPSILIFTAVQAWALWQKFESTKPPQASTKKWLLLVTVDLLAAALLYSITRKPESDLYLLWVIPMGFGVSFLPPRRFFSICIIAMFFLLVASLTAELFAHGWGGSFGSIILRIFCVRALLLTASILFAFQFLRLIHAYSSIWASLMQAMPEGLVIVAKHDRKVKWANSIVQKWEGRGANPAANLCYTPQQYSDYGSSDPFALAFERQIADGTIPIPEYYAHLPDGTPTPPDRNQWRRQSTRCAPIIFNTEVIAAVGCMREATTKEVLREATTKLQGSSSELDILQILVESIHALGYQRCRVYLLSADKRYLVGKYSCGMEDVKFLGLPIPRKGEPYSDETEQNFQPRVNSPPEHDPLREVLKKPPDMPWIEAPLKHGQHYYGKVSVDNLGHPNWARYTLIEEKNAVENALPSDDLSAIHHLSVQVSFALQHLRVRESMAELLKQHVHYSGGMFSILMAHANAIAEAKAGGKGAIREVDLRSAYENIESICTHMGIYGATVFDFCDSLLQLQQPTEIQCKEFDVIATANQVTGMCSFLAQEFKVTIEIGGNLRHAWVDGSVLRQIIFVLLTNAIRAIGYESQRHRGGKVQITFTARDAERILIAVRDDGPGVPANFVDLLFEPRARAGTYEGLGLGLYLVRRLAKMHGGDIRLSSNLPHQNVEFEVEILQSKESAS